MATVTTTVDVELDEFDTDDILRELQYRLKNNVRIAKYEAENIKSICAEILGNHSENNKIDSLLDTMKLELFLQGKDKKTLTDFENFFR